jgi:ArsR family transcriptional regulator, virulence genes transcriptional regulator
MKNNKLKSVNKNLNQVDIFEAHAAFCGIFSSPIRLKIMWQLGDKEKTVSQMAQDLNITIPNVSQHLRIMRDQGCVLTRRDGRTIFYRIANSKFLTGAHTIREGLLEEIQKKASIG